MRERAGEFAEDSDPRQVDQLTPLFLGIDFRAPAIAHIHERPDEMRGGAVLGGVADSRKPVLASAAIRAAELRLKRGILKNG